MTRSQLKEYHQKVIYVVLTIDISLQNFTEFATSPIKVTEKINSKGERKDKLIVLKLVL